MGVVQLIVLHIAEGVAIAIGYDMVVFIDAGTRQACINNALSGLQQVPIQIFLELLFEEVLQQFGTCIVTFGSHLCLVVYLQKS